MKSEFDAHQLQYVHIGEEKTKLEAQLEEVSCLCCGLTVVHDFNLNPAATLYSKERRGDIE